MVRLIPKKDGGLRPIALFRTAYRVFAKLQMWEFRAWICHQPRFGINMTSGRRTLDAAWRSRIRDLSRQGTYAAEIQMDLRKAFEQVNRARLLDLALHEGCPMRPLLTSLLSYRWPRRLVYQKFVASPINPTHGIAAGSSMATFELEIYLADAIRRATAILPRPVLSVHVDDISLYTTGDTLKSAAHNFQEALKAAYVAFVGTLELQFAPDKTQLMVSHKGARPTPP
jgi:hypothetical protein